VDGAPLTYADVERQVEQVSAFLHDQGIVKGDRVAILGQNAPNWGIAYLAIATMGAVVVPILTDFHPNEISHIVRHSGAKLVFVGSALYEKIAYADFELRPLMATLETFELIPPGVGRDKLKDLLAEGSQGLARLKAKAMKAAGLLREEVKEDDLAAIIYTSGTTGSSKGVMLSHKNLVFNAYTTITHIQPVDEHDRMISILPLSHTYECTIGFIIPLMQGASVYYLDKPPTARVLIPAMQKIRPTMMLTVPLVIEKIFKLQVYPQLTGNPAFRAAYRLPVLRRLLHRVAGRKLMRTFGGQLHFFGIGGALLSPDVERFLWEAGFPYAIGYGLTETSPLIAGCTPSKVQFRSTGFILPCLEARIDQPDPRTGEGEIQVRGSTVMKGYYRDKQRTEDAFTPDGWFRTGDLGVLTRKGYLYIKGRSKNVIIGPSGENIYPEELEAVLNEQEAVLESLVYETQGKLTARVYLNSEYLDKVHGLDKLSSHLAEKLVAHVLENVRQQVNRSVSSFSVIHRIIRQTEPFEKTPTQKIKRFLYLD